jgi:hypothetical protein
MFRSGLAAAIVEPTQPTSRETTTPWQRCEKRDLLRQLENRSPNPHGSPETRLLGTPGAPNPATSYSRGWQPGTYLHRPVGARTPDVNRYPSQESGTANRESTTQDDPTIRY